jgi:hypothetical protein
MKESDDMVTDHAAQSHGAGVALHHWPNRSILWAPLLSIGR